MKAGRLVRRADWNGKNMHIYLEDWCEGMMKFSGSHSPHKGAYAYEPVVIMFTAQGKHQPGWLASQADMLSDDWELAE